MNVDLAPVADTVAASFAPRNAPIGAYQREYGNDPAAVTKAVVAAVGRLPERRGQRDAQALPRARPGDRQHRPHAERHHRRDDHGRRRLPRAVPGRHPGRRRPGHGVLGALPEARPRQPGGVLRGRSSPACCARSSATTASSSPTTSAGRSPSRPSRLPTEPPGSSRRAATSSSPAYPSPSRRWSARCVTGRRRTPRSPPRSTRPPRGSSSSR